jgi:hypothetical protein
MEGHGGFSSLTLGEKPDERLTTVTTRTVPHQRSRHGFLDRRSPIFMGANSESLLSQSSFVCGMNLLRMELVEGLCIPERAPTIGSISLLLEKTEYFQSV